jgi:hypothetical protein
MRRKRDDLAAVGMFSMARGHEDLGSMGLRRRHPSRGFGRLSNGLWGSARR